MGKIYIKTFGCQMNEYDSAKMVDILSAHADYTVTDDPAAADIMLFNTCSVREKAQEKVFHDLGRIKQYKQHNPQLIIGVGGCVASQEGAAIVKRAPYVDLVFGPQTLHRLPQMIAAKRQTGRSQVDISFPEIEKFDHLPPARVVGASAFVSIMEGCSKYCTFCVVPYTRGEEVSRPFADVLAEVAELALQGVREITLLGQNVNAYTAAIRIQSANSSGNPSISSSQDNAADLALLIEYIAEIPGIERIRFTTSHPKEFTQRLIDCFGQIPQLASHVHLPVQAGADSVLGAMKRGYTALEYKSIVRRLRVQRPDISITSDFIVGFPGETANDFEQTMRLITDIEFDASFSFVYSPRPGTPAAALVDATPHAIKLERLQRLQALNETHTHAFSATLVGSQQRVLVLPPLDLETIPETQLLIPLRGQTDHNRMVHFVGPRTRIHTIQTVTITRAQARTLHGELLDHHPQIATQQFHSTHQRTASP